MLYGAEMWATTKRQEKLIVVKGMRMLRWMCGVTRKDKNTERTHRMNNESGAGFQNDHGETIERYSHMLRRHEGRILRKVLRKDVPGKRYRLCPKTRWKDACQRNSKSTGLRAGEEMDRTMWRRKIISHTGDHIQREKKTMVATVETNAV